MADKQIIDKFFSDLSSGTTWSVGVSIARKNALPLDNTSVFKSLTELNTYTANGMAYMGQPVAVVNEDGSVDFYVLDADKKPQEVGKATVGDDKSITLDNGVLKLFGFDAAPDGAQLSKSGDKLVWALPDTTTAEGQSAAIAALQAIINGTAANPETGAEATDGLVKKVADNAKAISDMDTAYKAADETTLSTAKSYTNTAISGLKVTIEQTEAGVEQIVIKSGDTVVSSVDASVFVQDSFLDDVSYNAETGKITFTWKMGDGVSTKTDEIDVSTLVDTYTAGTGLNLSNNEFSVNTSVIATVEYVDGAVEDSAEALTTEINKKANSADVESEIGRIETKIATDIAAAIKAALETETGAQKYALDADLTALKGRVSTAEGTLADVDSKKHTHANKEELDKIETGDKANWDAAFKAKHAHGNKTVLDSINSEKVAAWDAAEGNAKTYVEGYAATKDQGALADTAVQSLKVLGHTLDKNTKTSLTAEEAKTALGLGTAAYADASAFDAKDSAKAVQGNTQKTVADAWALADSKATMEEVNAAISGAGHASADDLTTHTGNDVIHVTKAQKDSWNAAVAKLEDLTGDDLTGSGSSTGGIAAMIETAINEHEVEADAKYATKTQTAADIKTAKETLEASIAETDKDVAQNTADVATLKEKDTAFESRIAALEGSKEDYKAADTNLKTNLEGQIATAKGELTTSIATAKSEAISDAKAYTNEVKATLLGENDKLVSTYDTLSEIGQWIETHGAAATDLAGALAAETKAREDADAEIDGRLDALELYDHSAYIAADTALKTNLEGQISTARTDLTAAIATAKSEAITAAATDAETKVKTLEDGAVATNTANISQNTTDIAKNAEDITALQSGKADKGVSYLKAETYTKAEVDTLLQNAEIKWATF